MTSINPFQRRKTRRNARATGAVSVFDSPGDKDRSGRKERRDGVGNATGLNALPAGVNATVLAHDGAVSIQCEWVQAQRGGDMAKCQTSQRMM